jgi:hypothetical protein
MRAEDLRVHIVHRFEVADVFQKYSASHHLIQTGSSSLENSGDILQGALRLLARVTIDDLPGSRIKGKLSAYEKSICRP